MFFPTHCIKCNSLLNLKDSGYCYTLHCTGCRQYNVHIFDDCIAEFIIFDDPKFGFVSIDNQYHKGIYKTTVDFKERRFILNESCNGFRLTKLKNLEKYLALLSLL